VLIERDHQMAFVFMAVLTCAGALIFPFIATYMVANTGMTQKQVPFIYLAGGMHFGQHEFDRTLGRPLRANRACFGSCPVARRYPS
jgi:predicted MFS family arabinose efflux permease